MRTKSTEKKSSLARNPQDKSMNERQKEITALLKQKLAETASLRFRNGNGRQKCSSWYIWPKNC